MNGNSLYDKIRQAVHKRWDPIGVAAYSEELGEYDSYVPALCKLIEQRASQDQIFEYLWIVETDSMGLSGDRQSTEAFAEWLNSLVS